MMCDTLVTLNQSVADIQASAIFSVDGIMLASTFAYDEDPDEVGAIVAAIQSLGSKTTDLLRRGTLRQIHVHGDKGSMMVSALDEATLLVILTRSNTNMGLLLHEIHRLRQQLIDKKPFKDIRTAP